jgi:hypothetical protein
VALREEFRSLEVRLQTARDDLYCANAKIKLLSGQKKTLDSVIPGADPTTFEFTATTPAL